jgi:hypothetical protein
MRSEPHQNARNRNLFANYSSTRTANPQRYRPRMTAQSSQRQHEAKMDTKTIASTVKRDQNGGVEPRDALRNGARENAKRRARKRRRFAPIHPSHDGRQARRDATVAGRDRRIKRIPYPSLLGWSRLVATQLPNNAGFRVVNRATARAERIAGGRCNSC